MQNSFPSVSSEKLPFGQMGVVSSGATEIVGDKS